MQTISRARVAPLVDAACIVAFVLIGRGNHGITEGVGWFVTVLWPMFVGWFGVALLIKLYTGAGGTWRALIITWLGGLILASLLRGTFTDRPYVGVFTVIAVVFLGLTTFGWRRFVAGFTRRRLLAGASK